MRQALVTLTALVAVVVVGCSSSKRDVEVEGVSIAQASGTIDVAAGPVVTLTAKQRVAEVSLPDGTAGEHVQLAIARDATFGAAKELIAKVEASGRKPVILVGDRHRLRAFHLNDEIKDPRKAIRLVASPDGKACVAPPDNPQSRCAEQVYSNHVSKASVREFIRDAIRAYGLDEVRVFARPSVQWADVIRAVDGARTCCDGKMTPRVRLVDDVDSDEASALNRKEPSDTTESATP